ncbi:hypothetical protein PCE1_003702 [Barthelona sp. PCE]
MDNIRTNRIMRELMLARQSELYVVVPIGTGLRRFMFCLKGPTQTVYEEGYYCGELILGPKYPFDACDIMMYTPSGRFETNTKICTSFTNYHVSDGYSPGGWCIETFIMGFSSFFEDDSSNHIGYVRNSNEIRKQLAHDSVNFVVPEEVDGGGVTALEFFNAHKDIEMKMEVSEPVKVEDDYYEDSEIESEDEIEDEDEGLFSDVEVISNVAVRSAWT